MEMSEKMQSKPQRYSNPQTSPTKPMAKRARQEFEIRKARFEETANDLFVALYLNSQDNSKQTQRALMNCFDRHVWAACNFGKDSIVVKCHVPAWLQIHAKLHGFEIAGTDDCFVFCF